jgi:hypothetical protein
VEPVDIILLSYNRLEYLIRTVEALDERTRDPFRVTLVDNASDSDVRNWIVANRHRFHRLILQPENEHIAGFQRGIDATESDPFVLAEPDLVVPALEPSWLRRLRDLMDRHPDFGLIGVGLDTANRPPVLGPERIDEAALVDGEIVEGNLGIWFQMIRRDALGERYEKDSAACAAIRAAGYRVGWAPGIRAFHLGWDDYVRHPAHLASKNELPSPYPSYREVELIAQPPTLEELAVAGPVVAEIRAQDVPEESTLELAWSAPMLGPALEKVTTIHPPPEPPLPLEDGSVGAVVLVDPPPGMADVMVAEGTRLAAALVVVVAPLGVFDGRAAAEIAPAGWTGIERPGVRPLTLELARRGDRLEAMRTHERYTTLEHRDRWLALFAAGSFGTTELRLFVLCRTERGEVPPSIPLAEPALRRWRPPKRMPDHASTTPHALRRMRYEIGVRTPAPVRHIIRSMTGRTRRRR